MLSCKLTIAEYRVILYAEERPFLGDGPGGRAFDEYILTVEHDVGSRNTLPLPSLPRHSSLVGVHARLEKALMNRK
jgi:hypothetical protein